MSERRGVSAAEKYAELEARGVERPRCECHGEPKSWNVRKWRCSVKDREVSANYRTNNADKERLRNARLRSDPDYRRRRTIYKLWYRHKQKMEGYVRSGLIDEGFTRRNDGEESSPSASRAA